MSFRYILVPIRFHTHIKSTLEYVLYFIQVVHQIPHALCLQSGTYQVQRPHKATIYKSLLYIQVPTKLNIHMK
jgi:hypothetical protein